MSNNDFSTMFTAQRNDLHQQLVESQMRAAPSPVGQGRPLPIPGSQPVGVGAHGGTGEMRPIPAGIINSATRD